MSERETLRHVEREEERMGMSDQSFNLRMESCWVCRGPITEADSFSGHVTAETPDSGGFASSIDLLVGWHDRCGRPDGGDVDGVQGRMGHWEPWMGAVLDRVFGR